MTVGVTPPALPTLLKWQCFYVVFFFFFSKKWRWNSVYQAMLSNKCEFSWMQFVLCSTLQLRSKISSCGVAWCPFKHCTAGGHCGSADKALSRWAMGWLCAWCLSERPCPEVGSVMWLRSCWLEDEVVCDEWGVTRQACSGWGKAGTWGWHWATHTNEIPTCALLTITCSLKSHRTEQNYCCSNVLVSSLGSLFWASDLGNFKCLENRP